MTDQDCRIDSVVLIERYADAALSGLLEPRACTNPDPISNANADTGEGHPEFLGKPTA